MRHVQRTVDGLLTTLMTGPGTGRSAVVAVDRAPTGRIVVVIGDGAPSPIVMLVMTDGEARALRNFLSDAIGADGAAS